ncbi:MAG: Regulator of RpoS [Anaerolineales bacterium]|nr:Regulator of RpoS [Anaerolineales bacterium]
MADLERILLVENDPDISDLIARQALKPLGYRVDVAAEAGSAIKHAVQTPPDLVIANLSLPGLSGKDLLVALTSRGADVPLIILAAKGQEQDALQAFRLGASDVLFWPARDAEIVSVVERVIKQVREKRSRAALDAQIKQVNEELQRKVRELTTIVALGKAVVSITDRKVLLDKIVEGAAQMTGADMGWLLLRDDANKTFPLTAHRGLPEAWAKKMGQPLDDGVSALVALSGETLLIHGEPLAKFKVWNLGKSAAVTPIKVKQEVIGLLVMVRKTDKSFGNIEQTLLEAVSDFASISLVNERLFRALAQTAESARTGEKKKNELFESLRRMVYNELQTMRYPISLMMTEKTGDLTDQQREALAACESALDRLSGAVQRTTPQKR